MRVMRVSGPSDAVALAVALAGYVPASGQVSVVPVGRVAGGLARPAGAVCSLPSDAGVAGEMLAAFVRSGPVPGPVVLAVFGLPSWGRALVEAVVAAGRGEDVVVAAGWHEGWVFPLPELGAGRAERFDVRSHPMVVEAMVAGRCVPLTLAEWAGTFAPQADPAGWVAFVALPEWAGRAVLCGGDDAGRAARAQVVALLARRLADPSGVTVGEAAQVVAALTSPFARDVVLACVAEQPEQTVEVLRRAVGLTPEPLAGHLLGACAMGAYLVGWTALARVLAEQATRSCPGQPTAQLVLDMAPAGVSPAQAAEGLRWAVARAGANTP